MEKENKKAEWKQQYQKRKGYFKEYYQKHKDVMDANNKKNAKKYREGYKQLEEENKKLKSDLAFERTMLDNVRAEYKSLQNVIKKLKEELSKLKEKYGDIDY